MEEIDEILEELKNIHFPTGILNQRILRYSALNNKSNELDAIFNLVESHVPSLRFKAILRYEKNRNSPENNFCTLNKDYVEFPCQTSNPVDNVNLLLNRIKELPEEWSVVQMTSLYNLNENINIEKNRFYNNGIHMSVFRCGSSFVKPFMVTVESPKDIISGKVIELVQEMQDIVASNKKLLFKTRDKELFRTNSEKSYFLNERRALDDRLKNLIGDIQDLWLKEWKCLLMGKYVNENIEKKIKGKIKEIIEREVPAFDIPERTLNILPYVIKGYRYLKMQELKRVIEYLFPNVDDKNFVKNIVQHIKNINEELNLNAEKRHPIILILDDYLDDLPWEMINVLKDEQVSRVSSFHFLYGLYREHKDSIKNGYKIIKHPQNGSYVLNPDCNLQSMENRLTSFLNYWLPEWTAFIGKKPTEEQFIKSLTTCNIFCYSGHGCGSHLFPLEKIQNTRIQAVVLLFGCSSNKLSFNGPQVEKYGAYQMYFIGCSPCIVGMLWEVTDLDTDLLTTEIISNWIPSKAPYHWKHLDKTIWKRGEKKIEFFNSTMSPAEIIVESVLLKVLSQIKRTLSIHYITKSACVARGIPVKIVQ